eukprot:gene1841-2164_t
MTTATLDLPTGIALERAIESIEAQTHDEQIRKTITERMAIANDPRTTFVTHKEAFAASKARLFNKLAGK